MGAKPAGLSLSSTRACAGFCMLCAVRCVLCFYHCVPCVDAASRRAVPGNDGLGLGSGVFWYI